MRSATTMRTAFQAIFGIAVLGGVAAALFWAVMSFNNNDDPNRPILSGTSIPAPTADDPQPAQPTPPPTAVLPTHEAASTLPTPADLPASAPTAAAIPPTEVSIQAPAVAPTASGPTPTPRVMRAPVVAPTAAPAASNGIAAEVVPTAAGDSVQAARVWPTPAPLVAAEPPTPTPDFGVVEATAPGRRSRQTPTPIGGRATVEPAIVPLRDAPPTPRGVVMPGAPTVVVPAIEPAQVVPTIVAIDANPAKAKTGRDKTPGPVTIAPNGAISPRGGRTPIVPGARGAQRGIPGVIHPASSPNKDPKQKDKNHNNGNGNGNGHNNNNNKDKNNGH
ncbi:MAG TPA: hypothetical protein VFQ80_03170 [Thermomicrobiales bacterium]|nr:hypothetical protein [Thermomicrobiales bacterium]